MEPCWPCSVTCEPDGWRSPDLFLGPSSPLSLFSGLSAFGRFMDELEGELCFFFLEKMNLESMLALFLVCGGRLWAAYGSLASASGVKGRE